MALSWLRSPLAQDLALAFLVGAPVVGTAGQAGGAGAAGLAALGVSSLLVRRRHPFVTLAALLALAAVTPARAAIEVPLFVALYTIGSRRSAEATALGVLAVIAVSVGSALLDGYSTQRVLSLALGCCVSGAFGRYIGGRRARIDALRERAERLERERELLSEKAAAQERIRIAHELHDIVAHNVSLMVVQAQALGATAQDAKVAEATTVIADLGREAMSEMHRTLRLLRAEDGVGERAPQPGLGELDALLDRARGAGLPVELTVEGPPRSLPQTVDLSAYRIVQEALTNVVKHAGRARSQVRLGYGRDALELTISDTGDPDGAAATAPGRPGGHGLIGMRERAALFGGTLTAGPLDGRGYEVRAVLPYGEGP